MHTEEKIFGPLTFKQFICSAFGIGISYLIYHSSLSTDYAYILIGVALLTTLLMVTRLQPQKIDLHNLEQYLERQKNILSPEKYKQMIQRKIAEISSQIYRRREKGLLANSELERALQIFEICSKK